METDQLGVDGDEAEFLSALESEMSEPAPSAAPDATEPDPGTSQPSDDEPPGQPRDDSGKFAKKGDAPAPAGTPAPPLAPDAAPTTPFRFRSVGQEIPLEGAHLTPTGDLVIPKSALPHAQQLFARGHEYATVGRQREAQFRVELAEAQAAASRPSEATVRATVIATELAKVLDDEAELVKFINDPAGYKANLTLRVENQLFRETSRLTRETEQSRTQQQQVEQAAQAQETEVPAMIRELVEHPSLKGKLTDDDIQTAEEHFAAFKGQLVRPATREEAESIGVQEGALIRVQTPVFTLLTKLAGIRDAHRAEQKAMAEAAKHNKALEGKPKGPPVAAPARTANPARVGKEPPTESREERKARVNRDLMSMKLEDLDE